MTIPAGKHQTPSSRTSAPSASSTATGQLERLRSGLKINSEPRIAEDHVRSILNARRGRDALLGQNLFSDPAWDILLELYASSLGDYEMSVSELGRAIDVPEPITVRWIKVLLEAGLIEFEAAESESGTFPVVLTQRALAKMAQLVGQWGSAFLAI